VLAALAVARLTEETTLAEVAAERFLLETISHFLQTDRHFIPAAQEELEQRQPIQPEQPEEIHG
jgi:hypothetical protein